MPWGYWLPLLILGIDVRALGSGNPGATNVWRVLGFRWGLTVALLDVAKGLAAALVGRWIGGDLIGVLAGFAAMAGHWRPLFLKWGKGGKMVATTGGVGLGLATHLANRPEPLGEDLVVVDRLEVDLARQDEVVVPKTVDFRERGPDHEPNRVLDEARREVRVLDDEELVRTLQKLVDRRAHRALDQPDEVRGVEADLGAEVERSAATLVVRRKRDELEDPLDVDADDAA